MAIMGKPVWAIVCGAIRQDFELYSTLAMLCDYRSKGMLDGIVISTWKGEPDNLPGLREKLKTLDISIVELNTLDEDISKYASLNFSRQAYQLKAGLDYIPNDVFVLKCRTDLSQKLFTKMEDLLRGEVDMTIGNHGSWQAPLNYRIAVMCLTIAQLFWFVDQIFIGYKADLYKMIRFDATVQYQRAAGPDMAFFFNIFADEYPIIREIILLTNKGTLFFNANIIVNRLQEYYADREQEKEDFQLPGAFNKLYALYFVILNNCFCVASPIRKEISKFNIIDAFLCDKIIGMTRDEAREAVINNTEVLRMIVNGGCLPTSGYLKLKNEIEKLREPMYAYRMSISEEDYNETSKWVKQYLKYDPSKQLFFSRQRKQDQEKSFDFEGTLDVLFPDISSDKKQASEMHTVMRNICFNKERPFYKAIIDNYDSLKHVDEDLFASAFSASTRSSLPFVLKYCAKELYFRKVPPKHEEKYRYIFERFKTTKHFYHKPITSDLLCALYYSGKYFEENGDPQPAKSFFAFISEYIDGKAVLSPEQIGYAASALQMIKDVASARYSEYQDNLEIRYMINFLYDEFGEDAFSAEAAEYLAPYFVERKHGRRFMLGEPDAYAQLLQAARKVRRQSEAQRMVNLLLREKSSQVLRLREEASGVIKSLLERFFIPDSCLLRLGCAGKQESVELDGAEINTEEDFVLLLRLLYADGRIGEMFERLSELCGDDMFRRFALFLFERMEREPRIRFFTTKRTPVSLDLWIADDKFIKKRIDEKLLTVHNNDWLPWIYSDAASPSKYAAFLRWEEKKKTLIFNAELAADRNPAKVQLLSYYRNKYNSGINTDARIVRLVRKTWPVDSPQMLEKAVDQALDEFCSVGDKLSASADKVKDDPFFDAPFTQKEVNIWTRLTNWLHDQRL